MPYINENQDLAINVAIDSTQSLYFDDSKYLSILNPNKINNILEEDEHHVNHN